MVSNLFLKRAELNVWRGTFFCLGGVKTSVTYLGYSSNSPIRAFISQAGLAVIAFGTLDKHGVNVPVIPIGLNYFRGHRFRARAVVEYGPPVRISDELYELYRRASCMGRSW